jgi:tocopherol O-methyltransferase
VQARDFARALTGTAAAKRGGMTKRNLAVLPLLLSQAPPSTGASHFGEKTASLLRKYGPGPRLHLNIGIFDGGTPDTTVDAELIRRRLVASQEVMMRRAAEVWDARRLFDGRLLDAGCGLGGGAIYWAQTCGARVIAATIVGEHLPIIGELARLAGVGDRVRPILADACKVDSSVRFDAVVAMESARYFLRDRWFQRLERIVRPGGVVCVEDTFLCREEWRQPFDACWKTRVGPVREYVEAARAAGFALDVDEDVTASTTEFWLQSAAWEEAQLDGAPDPVERERLTQSIRWHARFYRAWRDRGIEVRLLRFRKGK